MARKRRITEYQPEAYMSVSKAAKTCGVDRQRMTRWARLSGAEVKRGTIAFPKVFDFVQEQSASDAPAEGTAAGERYREAKAQIEEIKVAQLRRELVREDEVIAWWDNHMAPQIRVATDLLDRRFGAKAGDVLRDVLQRLTDEVERMGDGDEENT